MLGYIICDKLHDILLCMSSIHLVGLISSWCRFFFIYTRESPKVIYDVLSYGFVVYISGCANFCGSMVKYARVVICGDLLG